MVYDYKYTTGFTIKTDFKATHTLRFHQRQEARKKEKTSGQNV